MLGKEPRGLQRFLRALAQTRGLQLQSQRVRAACDAGWQVGEQVECARGIAIVERPLGRKKPRTLFCRTCRKTRACQVECALELLVALDAVLQAMRAARREQMAEHGELVVLRQIGRVGLNGQGTLRRGLRAAVATAEALSQRLAQR